MKPLIIVLMFAALLAFALPRLAGAAPAGIAQHLPQARLAGKGSYSWFGLTLYEAQLWVGPEGYLGLGEQAAPFALDLRYARAIPGKRIAAASLEQMRELGLGTDAQHLAWARTMEAIFPDVREGSHLTGVFTPPATVRFYAEGQSVGMVIDPQFAVAFFSIWLGPHTSAPGLRDALLAGAGPQP